MKLLKSQETELFDMIVDNGFSPLQFEIIFHKSNLKNLFDTTRLILKNTEYYFMFTSRNNRHFSIFCPGDETFKEEQFPGSWNLQKGYVFRWLIYLKREISTPDKWQRLLEESENLKLMKYNEDSGKFNASEYLEIKTKIELLKDGIKDLGLLENETKTINSKLDHLIELMPSMDKIDWKNILVGTLINLPIQLSLAPEITKGLFQLVKKIFSTYFLV